MSGPGGRGAGVSGLGGGGVSGPGGVCLGGCVSGLGGGVPGPGGWCAWSRGVLPQCLVGYHPSPVNRMTNRCKNITLATTSLRLVIIIIIINLLIPIPLIDKNLMINKYTSQVQLRNKISDLFFILITYYLLFEFGVAIYWRGWHGKILGGII